MGKHFLQMIMTISCALLLCGCGAAEQGTITMEHYPDAASQTEGASDEEADETGLVMTPQTDASAFRYPAGKPMFFWNCSND